MARVDIAVSTSGTKKVTDLKEQIKLLEKEQDKLKRSNIALEKSIKSLDRTDKNYTKTKQKLTDKIKKNNAAVKENNLLLKTHKTNTDSASKSTESMTSTAKGLTIAMTALATSMAVTKYIDYADEMTIINSKLSLVTDSTDDLVRVQSSLFEIAKDSRQAIEPTVTLYSRMARATDELGTSEADLLKVTETINKALQVSGATTMESASTITQLSQAMASGVLRGEEFNSIAENGARINQIFAKSLGVTIGELREMASEGKITTEVMLKALLDGASDVSDEFDVMGITFGQSAVVLDNSAIKMVGAIDKIINASKSLASINIEVASIFDTISAAISSHSAASDYGDAVLRIREINEELLELPLSARKQYRVLNEELMGLLELTEQLVEVEEVKTKEIKKQNKEYEISNVWASRLEKAGAKFAKTQEKIAKNKRDLSETEFNNEWLDFLEDERFAEEKINDELKKRKTLRDIEFDMIAQIVESSGKQTKIEKKKQKEDKDYSAERIDSYGILAGAMSDAFEEGSAAANAMAVVESTLAVIGGVNAVLTQGKGDPYSAFARMATMAVTVGSLLSNINKSISGSGGSSAPAGNVPASNATSFSQLNQVTADYGAVDFDSFIIGLNSASKALEDFGNIGSSLGKSIEAIDAQIKEKRFSYEQIKGSHFASESGVKKEIASRKKDLDNLILERTELLTESIINSLDLSNKSVSSAKNLLSDVGFDSDYIEAYRRDKETLQQLAIYAKQGLDFEEEARVLEQIADLTAQGSLVQIGDDWIDLIEIIEDSREAISKEKDTLLDQLELLNAKDDAERQEIERSRILADLLSDGNKALQEEVWAKQEAITATQELAEEEAKLLAEREALSSLIANEYKSLSDELFNMTHDEIEIREKLRTTIYDENLGIFDLITSQIALQKVEEERQAKLTSARDLILSDIERQVQAEYELADSFKNANLSMQSFIDELTYLPMEFGAIGSSLSSIFMQAGSTTSLSGAKTTETNITSFYSEAQKAISTEYDRLRAESESAFANRQAQAQASADAEKESLNSRINIIKEEKSLLDSFKSFSDSIRLKSLEESLNIDALYSKMNSTFNIIDGAKSLEYAQSYLTAYEKTATSASDLAFQKALIANKFERFEGSGKVATLDSLEDQLSNISTATLSNSSAIELLNKEEQESLDKLNEDTIRAMELLQETTAGLAPILEIELSDIQQTTMDYLGEDSPMVSWMKILNATTAGLSFNTYISTSETDGAYDLIAKENNVVPFANGGIVTKPTMALIGEAGHHEAVIPLKDNTDPLGVKAMIKELKEVKAELKLMKTFQAKSVAIGTKQLNTQRGIRSNTYNEETA